MGRPGSVSCSHLEQLVDELNLSPNIRIASPPRLPLPDHVHGLVSLDRSPRRLKLAKPLLGLYSSFDRSMILLRMLFKYWTGRWRQRWRNGSVSALRTADRSPVPPVQDLGICAIRGLSRV